MSSPVQQQLKTPAWPPLVAAFSILLVAFSLGLFSLPVFYPALALKFGWSRAAAVAGGSITLLLTGILGPLIGNLSDRFGPRPVLLAGMSLSVASLTLLSTLHSLNSYYGFCILLGISTATVSLVPTSMLIAPGFSKQRGTAIGLINAGVGVGGFIVPLLAGAMIDRHGVPRAFLWLALFPVIPLLLTLILVPAGTLQKGESRSLQHGQNPSRIPKGVDLWIIGFSLFFAAHSLTGIQQHLVLHFTGQGIKVGAARLALSVLLGASAFGKLGGGWLADRHSSRLSLILSGLCLIVAIGGLLTMRAGAGTIYTLAAIFGLGYGGVFNGPAIVAFEYFGTRGVGTPLGVLMMFFGLGTSSGGLLSGALYDRTHSYSASFSLDLVSAGLACLLLFLLPHLSRGFSREEAYQTSAL